MSSKPRRTNRKKKAAPPPAGVCGEVPAMTVSSHYPGLQGGMANYQIWFEYYMSLLENPPPQPDPTTYRRGRIAE